MSTTTLPAHRLQLGDVAPRQLAIAGIDTWNRLVVATRVEPGHDLAGRVVG
jgi:hypothetical protein